MSDVLIVLINFETWFLVSDDEDDTESSDVDPSYNNTRYECLRNTPLNPKHNGKLLAYLRILEKSRQVDMNNMQALAYRHAISAIKVSWPKHPIQSQDRGINFVLIGFRAILGNFGLIRKLGRS